MLNLDDKLALLDDYLDQFSDEEFAVRLESHGRYGPTAVSFSESLKSELPQYKTVEHSHTSISLDGGSMLNNYLIIERNNIDSGYSIEPENFTAVLKSSDLISGHIDTFRVCTTQENYGYAA